MIYEASVEIVNCDFILIERVAAIVDLLTGHRPTIHRRPRYLAHWRDLYTVRIGGQQRIVRLLESVGCYLTAKAPQARLLLAWCRHRIDVRRNGPRPAAGGTQRYTGVEEAVHSGLQALNCKGVGKNNRVYR